MDLSPNIPYSKGIPLVLDVVANEFTELHQKNGNFAWSIDDDFPPPSWAPSQLAPAVAICPQLAGKSSSISQAKVAPAGGGKSSSIDHAKLQFF